METKNDKLNQAPVIDLSRCTDCESCLEICPAVFKRNNETGIIEVVELSEYPEEDVREAMSVCPTDCITWEENL
ncbi:MAG: ferredoxin [Desulfobacteraceae bacterium]|nr:ferredoxin [Desulfobacteraceae bacterium]